MSMSGSIEGNFSFLMWISHQGQSTLVDIILLKGMNDITMMILGLDHHISRLFLQIQKLFIA
jgi:hypothetical protein